MVLTNRLAKNMVCVAVILAAPVCLLGSPPPVFDRWYVVRLGDRPVGWLHAAVSPSKEPSSAPLFTTVTEMAVTIRRGSDQVRVAVKSAFTETAEGRPVEVRFSQTLGQIEVTQTMRFSGRTVQWMRRQGGLEERKELPYPQVPAADHTHPDATGGWLTPAATQQWVRHHIGRGAKEIRYWSMDPSMGLQPYQTRIRVVEREDVQVIGKVVPAVLCERTVSTLPGITTREYLDLDGWAVKSTLSMMPGIALTVVEADQQLATAAVDPPELLASTLIRPNQPIAHPRRLVRAVYELTFDMPNGDSVAVGRALPTAGFQRVLHASPRAARVEVDLGRLADGTNDAPNQAHREATTMLNGQDPQIRALVRQALDGVSDEASIAEKVHTIRRFVHRFIQAKDLSVGLATASEVARTAQGDCTEHAVLLAAMLRGMGVPSRTVSGLIYVERFLNREGVFGYHMWTQAWLEKDTATGGRWVDLDATLGDGAFDAGHIALSTSAMSDTAIGNDLVAMVPIIGRLRVNVLQAKTVGAKPQVLR